MWYLFLCITNIIKWFICLFDINLYFILISKVIFAQCTPIWIIESFIWHYYTNCITNNKILNAKNVISRMISFKRLSFMKYFHIISIRVKKNASMYLLSIICQKIFIFPSPYLGKQCRNLFVFTLYLSKNKLGPCNLSSA